MYKREIVDVKIKDTDETQKAYVYLMNESFYINIAECVKIGSEFEIQHYH